MKFSKNQNTTNKLDTSSYTDELFGIKKRIAISHFSKRTDLVPEIDTNYVFDEATTLSIIMGFKYNKRVFKKWWFFYWVNDQPNDYILLNCNLFC